MHTALTIWTFSLLATPVPPTGAAAGVTPDWPTLRGAVDILAGAPPICQATKAELEAYDNLMKEAIPSLVATGLLADEAERQGRLVLGAEIRIRTSALFSSLLRNESSRLRAGEDCCTGCFGPAAVEADKRAMSMESQIKDVVAGPAAKWNPVERAELCAATPVEVRRKLLLDACTH